MVNIYEIKYDHVLEDDPDYTVIRTAETAGKARYEEYKEWEDSGSASTFAEYLKMIRVTKIGTSVPGAEKVPESVRSRIDVVNELIKEISSHGRRFLYSGVGKRHVVFHWASGRVWLTDDYSGRPIVMDKTIPKQHRLFSHGGTLWGLMCDFRDYILGDDRADGNNGYGGLYNPHWGYPEEDMEAIREKARELGYLKQQPIGITE